MANYIPLDILVNHIFIRLPVKSLLNCSCVCKLWLQTISDSEFRRIDAQHRSKQNPYHEKVICGPPKYRYGGCSYDHDLIGSGIFYSLDVESTPPKMNRLPGFPVARMKFRLVKALGYSHGMLCMEARSFTYNQWPYIFFGNPSTGYYKILPEPLVDGPLIVGFGYDSSTDDYKFVRIDNITRHPHIYSLKSDSWSTNVQTQSDYHEKKLEDSVLRNYVQEGTFFDGSIYWNVKDAIVRFNLKEEKFTEMNMPVDFGISVSLMAVGGSLCIINRHRHPYRKDLNVDMWLLNPEELLLNPDEIYMIKLLELRDHKAQDIYPLSIRKDRKVVCNVKHQIEVRDVPPKSHYILVDPNTSQVEDFSISESILKEFIFKSHLSGYIDTVTSPETCCWARLWEFSTRNGTLDTLQHKLRPL